MNILLGVLSYALLTIVMAVVLAAIYAVDGKGINEAFMHKAIQDFRDSLREMMGL